MGKRFVARGQARFDHNVLALIVYAAMVSGCSPDLPPLDIETEHVLIGTEFDGPVCAGTLDGFEQQVMFLEGLLGFEVDPKLELYLFHDARPWCDLPGGGCYFLGEARAYSDVFSAKHELVHAGLNQFHRGGNGFVDEMFATALTGNGWEFPRTFPGSNFAVRPSQVSHTPPATSCAG